MMWEKPPIACLAAVSQLTFYQQITKNFKEISNDVTFINLLLLFSFGPVNVNVLYTVQHCQISFSDLVALRHDVWITHWFSRAFYIVLSISSRGWY